MAAPTRILLLHGVATTSAVWDAVREHLSPLADAGYVVDAPDRPATGRLDDELAWLAPLAEGSWVVGFSGGATLALALAATPVRMLGALLHEPAVGSLVPGLLAPVTAAYEADGYSGFGRTLYGTGWQPEMAPEGGATVSRELPMFRAFEPGPRHPSQGNIVTSVGVDSPKPRHAAARALHDRFAFPVVATAGSHFAPYDEPAAYADVVARLVNPEGSARPSASGPELDRGDSE